MFAARCSQSKEEYFLTVLGFFPLVVTEEAGLFTSCHRPRKFPVINISNAHFGLENFRAQAVKVTKFIEVQILLYHWSLLILTVALWLTASLGTQYTMGGILPHKATNLVYKFIGGRYIEIEHLTFLGPKHFYTFFKCKYFPNAVHY